MNSLKSKIYSIRRHPSIMVDILRAKNWEYIEDKYRKLDEKEVFEFTSYLKRTSPHIINSSDQSKLNRLCYVEDWENSEIKEALTELQKLSSEGFTHRKDWEWALGIIAMLRFG